MRRNIGLGFIVLLTGLTVGCQSPSNADQGALFGGLAGAGLGAIIGHQMHNTGAGAAIGAGVGAVTGAVVGNKIDESEARNRALIEQRLGRPIGPGGVSPEDVIAMTRAGVDEQTIVIHVNNNGISRPLQTGDLIALKENGVSPNVVQAMQNPSRPPPPVIVQQAPPPVYVDGGYYDPYYRPYYRPYYYHRPPPPGIGVTIVP